MDKDMKHLTKENIRWPNKYMKRCSIKLTIKETKITATIRYDYTPIQIAKIKYNDETKI